MFTLDENIKYKFGLFKNLRSEEVDQKIYDAVYGACFNEMIKFIQEELDPSRKSFLTLELEKIEKEFPDDEQKVMERSMEVLFKYFTAIPHYRFKLNKRLEALVDKLFVASLKKSS